MSLAFAFALLGRILLDHDLEEELVNARHRRDDQLAILRDLHRRLQRRLRELLPVVGRAEVVADFDVALDLLLCDRTMPRLPRNL